MARIVGKWVSGSREPNFAGIPSTMNPALINKGWAPYWSFNVKKSNLPLAAVLSLALLVLAACAAPPPKSIRAADSAGPEVVQIALSVSNAYLIKSARPILIDAGAPKDGPTILAALKAQNVDMKDGLILLTHAHGDHGGAAAELRRATGAKIALGALDSVIAASGRNDELRPIGLEAKILKHIVDFKFEPYTPDIAISDSLDLSPWGVAGRAVLMPGHTPGSIIVSLNGREVFVGDMMRGGSMGGGVNPTQPNEHYFHADRERNRANIKELVDGKVEIFYLGHGGPVRREAVIKQFGLD